MYVYNLLPMIRCILWKISIRFKAKQIFAPLANFMHIETLQFREEQT